MSIDTKLIQSLIVNDDFEGLTKYFNDLPEGTTAEDINATFHLNNINASALWHFTHLLRSIS